MIYYIFKGQMFTLFLSTLHLTAVTFDEKIHDYAGGRKGEMRIYELNKKKTLVFEPTKKQFIDRSFLIFLKESKYHFNLSYSKLGANKDIEIKKAVKCSRLKLIKETKSYQLFECPKSLYLVNKSTKPIKVNGMPVKNKSWLSKGPIISIGQKIIYYQGDLL